MQVQIDGRTIAVSQPSKDLLVYFHNRLKAGVEVAESAANIQNIARSYGREALKQAKRVCHPEPKADALDRLIKLCP